MCVVECAKTSKACARRRAAASASVCVARYLAKELSEGLTITVTKESPGSETMVVTANDVMLAPTREGMQSSATAGLAGEKSRLEVLERLKELMMKEFQEETARLAQIESEKASEVRRLEGIYEQRIKTLKAEIVILRNKNEQLSKYAGIAAALQNVEERMTQEIARMKDAYDSDITALKTQIGSLRRPSQRLRPRRTRSARGSPPRCEPRGVFTRLRGGYSKRDGQIPRGVGLGPARSGGSPSPRGSRSTSRNASPRRRLLTPRRSPTPAPPNDPPVRRLSTARSSRSRFSTR